MSRYDGLIIPRSYSEYINKTDAATLQQALQLSGVLSGVVQSGDNKAVTSAAVNSFLMSYRLERVGEIYNTSNIYKVTTEGNYGRPIVIVTIGSGGFIDIAMFGQSCTKRLIRLGTAPTSIDYRYIDPPANTTNGVFFIKSALSSITQSIFYLDVYQKKSHSLSVTTQEEWDSANTF